MEDIFEVQWAYLAFGLLMLFFPRAWMRFGQLQSRKRQPRESLERFAQDGANDPDNKSVPLGRELRKGRNYVDFLRGCSGALAIWHFSFIADGSFRPLAFWLQILISAIAVIIQSTRWREKVTFFASIFFCAGLSIGMGNFYSAALAFLFVCAMNPLLATPRIFMGTFALMLLPFNSLIGAGFTLAMVNTSLVLLPPLMSLLAKRPLVIFTRKRNLMW